MFLQFWYPLWPQNLHLVRLIVFLNHFGALCLQLWWKLSFVAKTSFVLHRLQLAFELPWMMLKSLKSLMEVCYYFLYSKKYECLFLYLLKKKNTTTISSFIKKKKNWMSWILGIFIVLFYKWLFGFFFFFFFFFHFFFFVELVSGAALTLKWVMSTPTPIEIDDWLLLFGWVVLMTTYWVSLVFILTTYWCLDLTYWYVDFLLLDTNR